MKPCTAQPLKPQPLPASFYQREDVVAIAKELIGKRLFSAIGGGVTGGTIIETEAYRGPEDRASHAFQGRRSARNSAMYGLGGISYVYLCYGIHYLFNIVTNVAEVPHAILVRALLPSVGVEIMRKRRGRTPLTTGPANLCQALGITREHNALALQGPLLWVEKEEELIPPQDIMASPRIGITYAGSDAALPWRFHTC